MVCGEGRVRAPWEEVVKGELDGGEECVPKVKREGRVDSGEGRKDVVLRSADEPLCEVGTVVVGRDELDRRGGSARLEESANLCRRLIVGDKRGDGVTGIRKVAEDSTKGGEVGGGGFGRLGCKEGVATESGEQDVFVSRAGLQGKAPHEVRCGPLRAVCEGANGSWGDRWGVEFCVELVVGEGRGGEGIRESRGRGAGYSGNDGGRGELTGRTEPLSYQIEVTLGSGD